jgi:hypothetical protein
VLTGTEDGSYRRTQYDLQETPSGVTKDPFLDIEDIEILEATSSSQIADILTDRVNDSITVDKRIPSELFKWVGSFMTGLGIFGILKRQLKRQSR